jgi:stage V sporulation protein B
VTESAVQVSRAKPDGDAVTRSAGRGGLAVTFAKIYFILLGLVQQIALPRVLGLDGYGALSRVLSMASIAYNPVTTTSIQGMSRAVTQAAPQERPAVIRRLLSVHALFALALAGGFFALAPLLGEATGASHVVQGLRILSLVMLLYGVYTPLVGVLNGERRFVLQAGLDIGAATLRTAGLIVGALSFSSELGVEGAASGFALSALCIFLFALALVGTGKAGGGGMGVRAHVAFVAPILFGQVLLNLLLQADLQLLGRFASEAAVSRNLPAAAADPLVGAYRQTQLFSFLPYQILIALTFILFPMLAGAAHQGDRAAVQRYVKTGVRLALIIAGAMVAVTAGLAGPLLSLVFSDESRRLGTRALQLLAVGFGAFALFGIFTAVLNSLGRERDSARITGLAVVLVAVLCFVRVRGGPLDEELLVRTAQATTLGLFAAALGAAVLVRRSAGAVVAPLTLVRVVGALGTVVLVARHLPEPGKLMTLIYAGCLPLLYGLILVVSRELGRADLALVRTVLGRR